MLVLFVERDGEGGQRSRRILPARCAPRRYLDRKWRHEEWARLDYDPTLPIPLQSAEYHRRFREKIERINGRSPCLT